eukprot:365381-Chlamydomonas_euryale.AAC.36
MGSVSRDAVGGAAGPATHIVLHIFFQTHAHTIARQRGRAARRRACAALRPDPSMRATTRRC